MNRLWMMVLPSLLLGVQGFAQQPLASLEKGADPDPRSWTLRAYWENDGGILKRNGIEDRHYTNGIALTASGRPDVADRIGRYVPLGDGMDRTALGFVVGQLMFTPENLSRSDLIEDDRPYAGYLYGGVYWQRADESTLDHFELNLGVTGESSQAENLQDLVHEWRNGVDPRGWDNQLRDEPQVQAFFRRKWRFGGDVMQLGGTAVQAQLIPQAGVAVGTVYRHLEAAATVRVGWALPDDFGPARIADLASAVGAPRPGWYGYGFIQAGGRIVEHNVFLSGNNFKDSHGVDEEPLVGELTAGVAVGYRGQRWTGQVGYSQTVVGEEFKGQDGSNEYATLNLAITGWF